MSKKPEPKEAKKDKKSPSIVHPGMMGDGTEQQNLGEPGDSAKRIKKDEVDAAFGKKPEKKP